MENFEALSKTLTRSFSEDPFIMRKSAKKKAEINNSMRVFRNVINLYIYIYLIRVECILQNSIEEGSDTNSFFKGRQKIESRLMILEF